MKKNYKWFILTIGLLTVVALIAYTSLSWGDRIERSSVEATKMLESEGIKIRTVDTSNLIKEADPNETTTEISDTNEQDQSEVASPSQTKEEPKATEPETNNQGDHPEENTSTNGTATSAQPEAETKSLVKIKEAHMIQFLALEAEISASLEGVLNQALADYEAKKTNNEEINLNEFQVKYATKVMNLEATSDSRFNEIYKQLEAELIENGYDIKEAQPYRAQYRAEKQNREQKAIEQFSSMR